MQRGTPRNLAIVAGMIAGVWFAGAANAADQKEILIGAQ